MTLQEQVEQKRKKAEYNEEPVYYCTRCLSLRIMTVPRSNDSFCDRCNCNLIEVTTIDKWEELYKEKNHHSYLEEY